MVKIQINFSNRMAYTFIVIGIIILMGIGVYAVDGGNIFPDSGNVGIGTTSPSKIFTVQKSADNEWVARIYNPSKINALGLNVIAGDGDGQPIIRADDRMGDTKFTVLDTGNVGIGTTNPSEKLDVAGNVKATAFLYSSDENLKDNIREIEGGLVKVQQLEGVSFNWKESGEEDIGLIAQNVEEVFPELVSTDEVTGLKSVQYGNLVAVLIEAMKEQQGQIEDLKAEIEELKN